MLVDHLASTKEDMLDLAKEDLRITATATTAAGTTIRGVRAMNRHSLQVIKKHP